MRSEFIAAFGGIRTWAMDGRHLKTWVRHAYECPLAFGETRLVALEEKSAAARASRRSSAGGILVLPLLGVMTQRGGMSSAGTADFGQDFKAALADGDIAAIVLEVDSPGGEVYGVDEVATLVRSGRSDKPVVAVANSLAASAAYYIASQASELLVTPSGEVGSIGVYGVHEDFSKALDQEGVKLTFVSAGEGKTDGNPAEPLSDSARSDMQESVNRYYGMFVNAVARGRGVASEKIRSEWKAKVYGAKKAVEIGMADSVGTLDDAIRRATSLVRSRSMGASAAANAFYEEELDLEARARMRARGSVVQAAVTEPTAEPEGVIERVRRRFAEQEEK